MRQRIVQLSDMHLFANQDHELLGVNTSASFHAVLDCLKSDLVQPSQIILSGDLSQDGKEGAYLNLVESVKPFHVPVYVVPGNHDDVRMMQQVLPRENVLVDKHILLDGWDIILLNSQKMGEVPGYLAAGELQYLQAALNAHPDRRALIVLHHPPVHVDCPWLDSLSLTNADQFWQVATQHPRVHAVLFGHIHQQYETLVHGIHCFGVPSTCVQFKRESPEFALDNIPPGYRWFDLYPDGKLATGICRLPNYVGRFELNPSAY